MSITETPHAGRGHRRADRPKRLGITSLTRCSTAVANRDLVGRLPRKQVDHDRLVRAIEPATDLHGLDSAVIAEHPEPEQDHGASARVDAQLRETPGFCTDDDELGAVLDRRR